MTSVGSRQLVALASTFLLTAGFPSLAVAETKGFVVDWFHLATLGAGESCSHGLNPSSGAIYKHELARLGHPQQEIEALLKNYPDAAPGQVDYREYVIYRGRVGDKPVNIYAQPWTEPDPHIKTVDGRRAYGFNLDGKDGPDDFIEPITGESGIDNQLYRALGCIQSITGALPARPGLPESDWDMQRDYIPAWLIEISGLDTTRTEGDVTVGIYRSRSPIKRNAMGQATSDVTMWIDPKPRVQNVVHGKIKDGVITTDAFELDMLGDPWMTPEYKFQKARLRLQLDAEGNLKGILGGYQSWEAIYYGNLGSRGWTVEGFTGVDIPGAYYAMKRLADADPDPKTGQNRQISGTYWIEAVPAFLKREESISQREP